MDTLVAIAAFAGPLVTCAGSVAAIVWKGGRLEGRISAQIDSEAKLQAERQDATNDHLKRLNGSVSETRKEVEVVRKETNKIEKSIERCQTIQGECRRVLEAKGII